MIDMKTYLFEEARRNNMHLYAIVDSAVDGMIDGHFESDEPEKYILYKDEQDKLDLELKAPHLIVMHEEDLFTQRIFAEGYGNHWGCFMFSKETPARLTEHFCNYTKVYSQEHKQNVYIRFYDPRAIGEYFPLFDKEEAKAFFAPIEKIVVENSKNPAIFYNYSLHEATGQIQREEKQIKVNA